MKLLVVESPTKARKIYGILKGIYKEDSEWETIASLGHVADLPVDELGVDEDTLEPLWVKTPYQQKTLRRIISRAKDAEEIYIATDPDREGEAIGWHITKEMKRMQIRAPIFRCTFHEITHKAIKQAVENPTDFNRNRIEAQFARRILDRLIGYKISPILSARIGPGYSIGRVQAPALHFLAVRERERNNHIPHARWKLLANLSDGNKAESDWFDTELDALKILASNWEKNAVVSEITEKEIKSPPPFTTSRLIQEASRQLKISTNEVMGIAQSLFEAGNITYHRTDSIRMDWGFIGRAREFVSSLSPDSLSAKARNFPSEGAHEAIRPTDPTIMPSTLAGRPEKTVAVYKLIWARAISTQGSPAKVEIHRLGYGHKDNPIAWILGRKLVDPGWYATSAFYLKPDFHAIDPESELETKEVQKGWTEPPRRFTEAGLVRQMEEEGIGRPSTYSIVVPTLYGKRYIHQAGSILNATLKGQVTSAYLEQELPELVAPLFTAKMEALLDKIEQGEITRKECLDLIWVPIVPRLDDISELTTKEKCTCGADLKVVTGRKGPYLLCVEPECEHWFGIEPNSIGQLVKFESVDYPGECRICGKQALKTGQSQYGKYFWCTECDKKGEKCIQ